MTEKLLSDLVAQTAPPAGAAVLISVPDPSNPARRLFGALQAAALVAGPPLAVDVVEALATYGAVLIKGLGPGFSLDPVTGVLYFDGTLQQLTSYLLWVTGGRLVNDLDGSGNPLVFY